MSRACEWICILLVLLCPLCFTQQPSNASCRTPDNKQGNCINIKQCPSLIEILKKPKPLSTDDFNLLRNSNCGFEGRTPKVCCPTFVSSPLVTPIPDRLSLNPPDVSRHTNVGKVNRKGCGFATYDRVVGGNKTSLYEYPWMALIAYRENGKLSFRCGGTLITDHYVLTAAHCITNLKKGTTLAGVRLGEYNIDTTEDCQQISKTKYECSPKVQDFAIEEVIPHPDYSTTLFINDIGLLRIRGRPDFSRKNIGKICLPLGEMRFFQEESGIVAGWGVTESGRTSPILLKVALPIVSNSECNRIYGRVTTITHRQMCAGGKLGQDSCSGDSGGPFMYPGEVNNQASYVQQGIVSFGPTSMFCGSQGNPGVYTSVPHYMDWILDNIT